jgi:putative ABC transport system permease protein
MFRREWRQQLLLVALLAASVGAAVAGISAAYNAPKPGTAKFGLATELLRLDGSNAHALRAAVADARRQLGPVEVIGRRFAPVPGSIERVEYRAQDPNGRYGRPMLALRDGRYPALVREAAVTDGVADTLRLRIGDTLALDGHPRKVVGIVENPTDLEDEFALVAPSASDPPQSVTLLVGASAASFAHAHVSAAREIHGGDNQTTTAIWIFVAIAVLFLLVVLVVAAGFVAVAQRRLRQLGMLAAIGATEKHLRLVMATHGAIVGVLATALGACSGLALWVWLAPVLETAAGHRVDRLHLPWALIVLTLLLAVGMATAAAWWPARSVARIPVMVALSGRPPRPLPARGSAAIAGLLIPAGVTALAVAHRDSAVLTIFGTLATLLGVLFISPLAISALAGAGARAPISVRLAIRDLARHQARAGTALAAITLALGITVAIVVATAAAQSGTKTGNLSDRQLVVRIGQPGQIEVPVRTRAQLSALTHEVRRLAGNLGRPHIMRLDVPVDPSLPTASSEHGSSWHAIDLAIAAPGGHYRAAPLYVAAPQLLDRLGVDASALNPSVDIVTIHRGRIIAASRERTAGRVQRIPSPPERYTSAPTSLVTHEGLRRLGWKPVPYGWFIEAPRRLTSPQLAAARHIAADAGLTVEARDRQTDLKTTSVVATAVGALLAFGILAMTVGLIRAEAAGDMRILAATGARRRTSRTLTAATAGALALLGTILGTLSAYLTLGAAYLDNPSKLSNVPVAALLLTVFGIPAAAALGAWLLASSEPPAIPRHAIE